MKKIRNSLNVLDDNFKLFAIPNRNPRKTQRIVKKTKF